MQEFHEESWEKKLEISKKNLLISQLRTLIQFGRKNL